ncbi:MAG TPA: TolC family protein, partial [Gemmataceae bacterium]|nr:TolC family protein [Gemmataceae bacterium]
LEAKHSPVPLPAGIGPPATAASVIPAAASERTIELGMVLELAGAQNPTIARALESVRASLAVQLQADALLLPTLDAGVNLNEHWGNIQNSQGVLEDVQRQALYVGAGTGAIGAGTVSVPGVRITAHLADALFEPRATRQEATGRRFDAAATRNSVLLDAADAYFELIGAEARLAALRQSQGEIGEIVRLTTNFAATRFGREGDANRARSEALLLQVEEQRVQEEAASAATELARLLDLDPTVRLHGSGESLPLIQLMSPDENLERLVSIAIANHPDIAARTADVAAAQTRWRQERVRPFVPYLAVGFSAGQFGGGGSLAETRFGHFDGRTDFDALAVWSLENLGLGNWAIQRQRRAALDERAAERQEAIARVRRETAEAFADTAARRREVDVALREIQTATASYREDLNRIRGGLGLPIEVLVSATQLATARLNFIRAVIEHDKAQFRLLVALGLPPSAV